MAVGSFTDAALVRVVFAEAWNGSRWRIVTASTPSAAVPGAFNGVSCTRRNACVAVGTGNTSNARNQYPGLAARWDGRRWSLLPSPPVMDLHGVACPSTRICEAVGDGAARWNGHRWAAEAVRSPVMVTLTSVSCPSMISCVAVGDYAGGDFEVSPVVEHWDGLRWSVASIPTDGLDIGSEVDASLSGVSCGSVDDCVAMGAASAEGIGDQAVGQPFVEHLHHGRWTISLKSPADSGVSCVSPVACVAVGGTAAAWNGRRWRRSDAGIPAGFVAVSCVTPTLCTAVGETSHPYRDDTALAARWRHRHWSIQNTAQGPGTVSSQLAAVSCSAPHACVAVGSLNYNDDSNRDPFAELWDGTAWSVRSPPSLTLTGSAELDAVSCPSTTRCVAVGYLTSGTQGDTADARALVERWDGSSWTADVLSSVRGELLGVSCLSADACTAVGVSATPGGSALVEVWNGVGWAPESDPPTATLPAFTVDLTAVSCPASERCVAVGEAGFVATWDGSAWVSQLLTGQPQLTAVSCPSINVCVTVGTTQTLGTYAAVWNGSSWAGQATPDGPINGPASFDGVWCSAVTDCTGVGEGYITGQLTGALAAGWNGSAWLRQDVPDAIGVVLSGVSCTTSTACIAVGYRSLPTVNEPLLPFVERSS